MNIQEALKATPADIERSYKLRLAIIDEIRESKDGLMSFGDFAQRSMYGYDADLPGYYTNTNFSPNNPDGDSSDTFGTAAVYPGVGAAIGEIAVIELAGMIGTNPLTLIEVGGGDGIMMRNMIVGSGKQLQREGLSRTIHPIMIDRTPQLLDRQASAIQEVRVSDNTLRVADPLLVGSRLEDAEMPSQAVGAVISNELLDMLPFEVACDIEESVPGMFYVKVVNGKIVPAFAPARSEYMDDAAYTLEKNPHKPLQSFQPTLIESVKQLADLIEQGVIITTDYKAGCEPDVQVMRNGVSGVPLMELQFPGLFDISVVPDWAKIRKWAIAAYGKENVEFESLGSFILSSETHDDLSKIFPKNRQKKDARELLRQLATMAMGNYDTLLIRK